MKLIRAALVTLVVLATGPRLMAQLTESYTFNNLNRTIPDGNPAGIADFRTVPSGIVSISSIKVKLNVSGNFNGDLYGYVTHSSGFTVLLNRPGKTAAAPGGYDDSGFDITLQDGAVNGDVHNYRSVSTPSAGSPLTGIFEPDARSVDPASVLNTSSRTAYFSSFNGLSANGDWTLFLADLESGGTNQLKSWELQITGQALPIVTWSAPPSLTYGTALGASQLNASAGVPGTFAYSPAAGTVLNAGNGQTLQAIFTPTDPVSYQKVTNTVVIDVLKAPLTITAQDKSKVYGAALPALTASYSGFVNGDTSASLDTPVNLVTTAITSSAAGTYPITASGAVDANYTISFVNGTLTVSKAPLIITAQDKSKVYGAALPALTASYSGFVNGDTSASLDTPVNLVTTAITSSAAGTYPITASAAADANYTISFVNGTLTVDKAALTITAQDKSKVYGAALPALTASYSGFVNGDTSASLDTPVNLVTTAITSSAAGTYPITASGAVDVNYTISFVNGTLTVNKSGSTGVVGASPSPAQPGVSVTLTFAVNAVAPGAGTPSGPVQFKVDGTALGAPSVLAGGSASRSTSSLSSGTHSVTAEYAGDANFTGATNSLAPLLVVNTPPVAGDDTITRFPDQGVKVLLVSLLSNDTDPDGDTVTLDTISATSAAGGVVSLQNPWVHYTPPAGYTNGDSFTYVVKDGRGGTATGTVNIIINSDVGQTQNLTVQDLGNGSFRIRYFGIPGRTYDLQHTESLVTPTWQTIIRGIMSELGYHDVIDTPPVGSPTRYYRTVCPPL